MSVSLLEHFSSLQDPRVERNQRHALLDIVLLAVCAVMSGAGTVGNRSRSLVARNLTGFGSSVGSPMACHRMTASRTPFRASRQRDLGNVSTAGPRR